MPDLPPRTVVVHVERPETKARAIPVTCFGTDSLGTAEEREERFNDEITDLCIKHGFACIYTFCDLKERDVAPKTRASEPLGIALRDKSVADRLNEMRQAFLKIARECE